MKWYRCWLQTKVMVSYIFTKCFTIVYRLPSCHTQFSCKYYQAPVSAQAGELALLSISPKIIGQLHIFLHTKMKLGYDWHAGMHRIKEGFMFFYHFAVQHWPDGLDG